MFVDKLMGGIQCIQTLSRLNRCYRDGQIEKTDTMVIDFRNHAEDVQEAFQKYYQRTELEGGVDLQRLYTLKNNIFVNVGKSAGQVVVGFNKGGTSANPAWDVDGNVFNYDGADKSADEVAKAGKKAEEDIVKNSVAGVVTFTDAANGDFNGKIKLAPGTVAPATLPGDARWTLTTEATKLYIIGDMNSWSRTAMTEMTFNAETQEFAFIRLSCFRKSYRKAAGGCRI